ncbi:hypothetical protein [Paractinoplanes maris]|uniref:hypothetical protein n=1 Tax=Paractinoplanes maris TaxID=1734446 RepID=UPI0020227475|nr:hypothetical protein [Actinoplanes maris]
MDADQQRLLTLAKQLRDAAEAAGRADVVAQVDDVILLLAHAEPPAGETKTNVVLRILDGLGF